MGTLPVGLLLSKVGSICSSWPNCVSFLLGIVVAWCVGSSCCTISFCLGIAAGSIFGEWLGLLSLICGMPS